MSGISVLKVNTTKKFGTFKEVFINNKFFPSFKGEFVGKMTWGV